MIVLDQVKASQNKALLLALAGGAALAFGFGFNTTIFFQSYLQSFIFVLAIPLGCLAILMIHSLTGGGWGWAIRPFLLMGVRTLPFVALLFIPIVLGVKVLYPWTNVEAVHHDPILSSKAAYLTLNFWMARAAFYFVIWMIFWFFIERNLEKSPGSHSISQKHRLQRWSAGGLVVLALSVSFAAIDWLMSLEPHWFSSIFGVILIVSCLMSAFCICSWWALKLRHQNSWLSQKHWHDLGKFVFMTIPLWGYINLSQFLIIWSGNMPEETFWYYDRSLGIWKALGVILIFGQFVIPFLALLPRVNKLNPKIFAAVIACMLTMRYIEQVWLVAPSVRESASLHWLDLAAPIGMLSLWVFLFLRGISKVDFVPGGPALAGGHDHEIVEDKPHGEKPKGKK